MRRRLPSSGFGPTGERMEDWSWRMAVNAKTVGGHYVRVDLDADGQPGYLATAKMLGEAGLLLSEKGATPERSGFLTPAAALGTRAARPLPPRRRALPGLLLGGALLGGRAAEPAASRRASARSVRSQVKSSSARPKWP